MPDNPTIFSEIYEFLRFGKVYKQGHSLVVAIPYKLAKEQNLSPGDSVIIGFAKTRRDGPTRLFFFFKKVPSNAVEDSKAWLKDEDP